LTTRDTSMGTEAPTSVVIPVHCAPKKAVSCKAIWPRAALLFGRFSATLSGRDPELLTRRYDVNQDRDEIFRNRWLERAAAHGGARSFSDPPPLPGGGCTTCPDCPGTQTGPPHREPLGPQLPPARTGRALPQSSERSKPTEDVLDPPAVY